MARDESEINATLIEKGVTQILKGLGCDLKDKNFTDTPERVARFYIEMFGNKEIEYATFPEDHSDFILLKGHKMWGLCPHHLLPVELIVSLAYIPSGQVLGLSKLARILDECNSGPILQERITREICDAIKDQVPNVQGSAVYIDGQHGCTRIRGVRSEGRFVTYRLEGAFKDDPHLENRFFQLVKV